MAKLELWFPVDWFETHKKRFLEDGNAEQEGWGEDKPEPIYIISAEIDLDNQSAGFKEGLMQVSGEIKRVEGSWISFEKIPVDSAALTSIFEWISKMANKFRSLLQSLPKSPE